ncbi:uncharacterized protein LOC127725484 isoform X1 [Mytilus californianus]|uniref:uncharacterized protein LOC127725484 isoform X1 n=2 Tax=Mytilus californianus TaxID=6549 RepID=UPI0022459158|nr:uncharacterized protein LOC127725484 isoform X1 [Mytilus californianus]
MCDMPESENCAACLRDNERNKANLWCYDCLEALCEPCGKVHRKFSTPHKVNDIQKISMMDRTVSKLCHRHAGQALKAFCECHDQVLCQMCISENHSKCKNVQSIENASEERKDGSDLKGLQERLTQLNIHAKDVVIKISNRSEQLQQQKISVLNEILKIRELVNGKLDQIEKGVLCRFSQQNHKISEIENKLKTLQSDLDSNIETADHLNYITNQTHFFLMLQHLRTIQDANEKDIVKTKQELESIQLNMIPANFARKLTDLISSLEETGYTDHSLLNEKQLHIHGKISTEFISATKIQTLTPTKGFIFGACCFTEDNRIVLTESKWDSKYKLSIFDIKSGKTGRVSISLPEEPNQLCSFEKSRVLVTCKNKLPIVVVDVQSITTDRKYIRPCIESLVGKDTSQNSECSFIFGRGFQIWVCIQCCIKGEDSAYICSINFDGEILKSIPLKTDISDMCINFRCDSFICTHKDRKEISEVSVTGENTVYYKNGDVRNNCRIASDASGGVYVCEPITNTLYKLRFGERNTVLTEKDGIASVSHVNFNNRTNELVLTSNGGECVYVYHVQN